MYTVAPYVRTPEDVVRSLAPHDERDPSPHPRPEQKRVWASLEKNPDQVLSEVFREAKTRDPDGRKSWVALVDGNKTQLEILEDLAGLHGVDLTIVLDIMHVAEYLWNASLAFHAEDSKQREDSGQRAPPRSPERTSQARGGWHSTQRTRRRVRGSRRKLVGKAADYLIEYKRYLRYDDYLGRGFPIATGVVEGTCRHLVCDRMDVGARWSLAGAEAVLRLRALRVSHDFEAYWKYHEDQEYERNHATRYAGGTAVPVRVSGPVIRRVK